MFEFASMSVPLGDTKIVYDSFVFTLVVALAPSWLESQKCSNTAPKVDFIDLLIWARISERCFMTLHLHLSGLSKSSLH